MKKIVISLIFLSVLTGLGLYVARWELREPVFEIYFFNLNRGRSVFIRTPHGKTVLIDGGQSGQILRELGKALPFYRRRIDMVIMTSAMPKNIGGLVDLVERYEVGKIIEPEIMSTSTALAALRKIMRSKKLFPEYVEKGDEFVVDDVTFKILFPEPGFKFNKTSTPEMVIRIDYATTTILLLGDVSKTIQKRVAKSLDKAEIVEFAHGATKSRVSADLLVKLEPDIVISTKRAETLRYIFK